MNQSPQFHIGSPGESVDEEYEMPCAEALLAGTLALMTGHAQSCCADHRNLMACKVTSNLFVLSQHPLLSPGFQAMLFNLHGRWRQQVQSQAQSASGADSAHHSQALAAENTAINLDQSRALWHTTPEMSQ